jgi:hypothetical protein
MNASSDRFNFTDTEFLNVVNLLCKLDLDEEEYTPLTSMDSHLNMEQLDSLSMTVFFIWIVHLFGIPEATMREFVSNGKFTIRLIKNFVMHNATRTYSYAEAQKYTKKAATYFGGKLEK